MNPFVVLHKHYAPDSDLCRILTVHSVLVTHKALEIARDYLERHPGANVDLEFLSEAGMLHDIGIKLCHAPRIFCQGAEPYVRHGVLGQALLEQEGLPKHALVCSRHTGAGISRDDVLAQELPLPVQDFLPVSIEEKILCVADKYYSKTPQKLWKEKRCDAIARSVARHGEGSLARWEILRHEVLGT